MVLSVWGDLAQQYEPPGLVGLLGFLILGHSKNPFERGKSSKPQNFCRFWNQRVPNTPTQLFSNFGKFCNFWWNFTVSEDFRVLGLARVGVFGRPGRVLRVLGKFEKILENFGGFWDFSRILKLGRAVRPCNLLKFVEKSWFWTAPPQFPHKKGTAFLQKFP